MQPRALRCWFLAAVALGLVGLVAVGGSDLWRFATRKQVVGWGWWYEGDVCHSTIYSAEVPRFERARTTIFSRTDHYWESGFLACEAEFDGDGRIARLTRWAPNGAIVEQISRVDPSTGSLLPPQAQRRRSPPWWWGAQPQTQPTAPWWDHQRQEPSWWPEPEP